MREKIHRFFIVIALLVATGASAQKQVYYQDKNITIYTDNTVVRTGEKTAMAFPASKTWVEEDFFTQQAKYCEVDGVKMKKALSKLTQSKNVSNN